ncbi:MAG: hypothetical protein Q4B68_03800, partial [Bacteroidales bacterium]|nr:hypothetical protein [Bacteroidales bacterium]
IARYLRVNTRMGDPKFYVNREKYIFDYRLMNESDAIARGDRSLCPESARYDRYGNDRFASGSATDLGAYVWIPGKAEEEMAKSMFSPLKLRPTKK